jgi:hypothetical protein
MSAERTAHAGSEYPGGYTKVPNWISLEKRLSRDAKALVAGLLHNEWEKTQPHYKRPGQAALALWIGSNKPNRRGEYVACKQTVIDAEAELERWNLIRVDRRDRAKSIPRRAVKTAHVWAVENRTPVGGHFETARLIGV